MRHVPVLQLCRHAAAPGLLAALLLCIPASTAMAENVADLRFKNTPPAMSPPLPPEPPAAQPPVARPPVVYPPDFRPPGYRPPVYRPPRPVVYVNDHDRVYYVEQPAPAAQSAPPEERGPAMPRTTTTYSEVKCAGDMMIRKKADGTPVMEYVGPSGECR